MQERSLPAYIEWSFEFRTPQLLTHKKLWLLPKSKLPSEFRTSQLVSDKKWLLPNLKGFPNFGPLDSVTLIREKERWLYYLNGKVFQISHPSTLIREKTMITTYLGMPSEFRTPQLVYDKKRWFYQGIKTYKCENEKREWQNADTHCYISARLL